LSGAWGRGFYFTNNTKIASQYSADNGQFLTGSNVMPVFLSIKNPITLDFRKPRSSWTDEQKDFRKKTGLGKDTNTITDDLISKGYDGIIVLDHNDNEYIVFEPRQIKSALSNNGNFDLASDNINEKLVLTKDFNTFKFGDSKIVYNCTNDEIHISSLRTPATKRGNGSARAAMVEFLKYTDDLNVSTSLASSPLDKKTNGTKLLNFYKSLGYIETGKKINMLGDKELFRQAERTTSNISEALKLLNESLISIPDAIWQREIADVYYNDGSTRGILVIMPPEKFLKLTPVDPYIKDRTEKKGKFNPSLFYEPRMPKLFIGKDNHKIVGHEGRSRVLLAMQSKIKFVPIIIVLDKSNKIVNLEDAPEVLEAEESSFNYRINHIQLLNYPFNNILK